MSGYVCSRFQFIPHVENFISLDACKFTCSQEYLEGRFLYALLLAEKHWLEE